ncbi:site-2 protease family protein [Cytobacillus sp. S13-E01]|uniref:site-2 protease family protein n=1 Tax=Cytobacillus sp. S13-E01 TaxID=3031326 RepID=UPI0023D8213F|nr:site-2 protease family protein [Cytobacillus sp. S13-E01]MDF0728079.1 site-2 protease family protein [Cytobacillus sp. S13-E01]
MLLIGFLLLAAPISNLLHEIGHILVARFFQVRGTQISLGIGPKLFGLKVGGTFLEINLVYFIGAFSKNDSSLEISDFKKAMIAVGGPVMNIVIAVVMMRIYEIENMLVSLTIFYNIWLGIMNLLPYKFIGKASDGWVFLSSLFEQMKNNYRKNRGV